jgi:hypothetical protein
VPVAPIGLVAPGAATVRDTTSLHEEIAFLPKTLRLIQGTQIQPRIGNCFDRVVELSGRITQAVVAANVLWFVTHKLRQGFGFFLEDFSK